MADSLPGLRGGEPPPLLLLSPSPLAGAPEAATEPEAEVSLSLAFAKTRSYGSTASVAASLAGLQRYREHRLGPGDTLQGLALKYGVTMEQIKRANKLFTNDCIFLRKTLNIPVISEKPLLFNGLSSLDSPENESMSSPTSCEDDPVTVQEDKSSPSPQESDNPLLPPEELSAKDFLHRLDLQIKLSKQAARKLKPEDTREEDEDEENPYATSSYQQ